MPLVCHVGARRVHVSADMGVEWPERRGSFARREIWERLGRSLGVSAVAAAGIAAAWGTCWEGRGVLPLACHEGARRGRVGTGVRVERPKRRGSVARRETQERRGWSSGAGAAAAAGVATFCACRAVHARVESERCEGLRRRCRPSNTGRCGLWCG